MDDGLTREQLAEIRARCEAATPGPWDSFRSMDHPEQGGIPVCKAAPFGWNNLLTIVSVRNDKIPGMPPRDEARFRNLADCNFVALARQDVPALLDEIARLQEIVSGFADRIAAQSELLSKRAEK